jgi:hypothetical protein
VVPAKNKYADSKSSAYLRGTWLKVPDSNIGVPPVRKYANYRTLKVMYGKAWYGMGCMVKHGMVWYGMVWYGMVWYGMVWYCLIW